MMYNVPNLTREKAYDMARHEFYVLRQQEEIEARVAREEASHLGAYFGKSHLQISTQLEDNQFEHWKKWAARQIADKKLSNESAYTSFGEEEEVADEDEDYAVDAPEAEPSPVVTRS